MQFTLVTIAFLASLVAARDFTLYDEANRRGNYNRETRDNDGACWNLNGKGDRSSSVGGSGCTIFYRERDCSGANWANWGDANTVPDFLNDHIWSFRNGNYCCDRDGWSRCNQLCNVKCISNEGGIASCLASCHETCRVDAHCLAA